MTPDEYISSLPEDRQDAMSKLRKAIKKNLPKGFQESVAGGMLNYSVPHKTYPAGYHCNPKLPLPFACIASQKGGISLYHMGVYSFPEILEWFTNEYPKHSTKKLDMGKSCIRFKNPDEIPYDLIGELMKKITVNDWIERYESVLKR